MSKDKYMLVLMMLVLIGNNSCIGAIFVPDFWSLLRRQQANLSKSIERSNAGKNTSTSKLTSTDIKQFEECFLCGEEDDTLDDECFFGEEGSRKQTAVFVGFAYAYNS